MMLSRRIPSPTGPSTWMPSSSGPRCTRVRHMAWMSAASTDSVRSVLSFPTIPHMIESGSFLKWGTLSPKGEVPYSLRVTGSAHAPLGARFGFEYQPELRTGWGVTAKFVPTAPTAYQAFRSVAAIPQGQGTGDG